MIELQASCILFLEALEAAPPGGVLVIDNGARADEARIGDLTVAEVRLAGLSGRRNRDLRCPVRRLASCECA